MNVIALTMLLIMINAATISLKKNLKSFVRSAESILFIKERILEKATREELLEIVHCFVNFAIVGGPVFW